MKSSTLKFLIDSIAFVAFVLLASTGLLMRFVLPPGSGRFRALWGMDRHEWGQLHFWIAVTMLAAIALHLVLNWKWVVCMVRGQRPRGAGLRVALAVAGLAAVVALAAAPFFGRVEQAGEPPHRLRVAEAGGDSADLAGPPAADAPHRGRGAGAGEGEGPAIDGSMTLAAVERLTGVPAAVVLRELGLPEDLPRDENLGRLRRAHGFEMQDVREAVRKHLGER